METETRENQTTGDVELPPKSPTATEIFSVTKLDIPIIEISENKKSEKTSAQLGRQGEKIIDIQENRNNFSISSPEKKQILKNFVILHGDNRYVSTMLDINKLTMENLFYLLENQCIIDEVKLGKKEYNLYFEKKKEDLIIDNLSIPSASPPSPSFFEFDSLEHQMDNDILVEDNLCLSDYENYFSEKQSTILLLKPNKRPRNLFIEIFNSCEIEKKKKKPEKNEEIKIFEEEFTYFHAIVECNLLGEFYLIYHQFVKIKEIINYLLQFLPSQIIQGKEVPKYSLVLSNNMDYTLPENELLSIYTSEEDTGTVEVNKTLKLTLLIENSNFASMDEMDFQKLTNLQINNTQSRSNSDIPGSTKYMNTILLSATPPNTSYISERMAERSSNVGPPPNTTSQSGFNLDRKIASMSMYPSLLSGEFVYFYFKHCKYIRYPTKYFSSGCLFITNFQVIFFSSERSSYVCIPPYLFPYFPSLSFSSSRSFLFLYSPVTF